MERSQFTFYESFFKAISRIKKKQARADAYDAICAYALYGTEPELSCMEDSAAIAFELVRPVLDKARRKAVSGKLGGEAKPAEADASKQEAPPSKPKAKPAEPKKPDAFDAFWAAYPKKVGKDAARRAFGKVNVPVAVLVGAVNKQRQSDQWKKDGGQYIPNPATWLNQGRWEDELTVSGIVPKGAVGGLGEAELEAIRKAIEA